MHLVVIVGGGYPIHPFTVEHIDQLLRDEGLLTDARIGRLAVVDIGEVEILEALGSRGCYHGNVVNTVMNDWYKATCL